MKKYNKTKLKKFLKSQGYHTIVLNTLPSGHHVLKARLNGVKGVFILDTGASSTCVDTGKTGKFKLKTKETDHKATGAGTADIDIQLSKKNQLKIKDWSIKKLPVVVMDLSHINSALAMFDIEVDGIIGSDILHQGKGIIQYEKERLFLK